MAGSHQANFWQSFGEDPRLDFKDAPMSSEPRCASGQNALRAFEVGHGLDQELADLTPSDRVVGPGQTWHIFRKG